MPKIINITATKYEPNLLILKNHIVAYDKNEFFLYDIYGKKLNYYNFEDANFLKIIKINDTILISFENNRLYEIKINNNNIKIPKIIKFNIQEPIENILFIKESNILIIGFITFFQLFDIYTLSPFQTIYKSSLEFLNLNNNKLIHYNENEINIYEKINGIKTYQLLLNIKLKHCVKVIKFNNKELIIADRENLYHMNVYKYKLKNIFFNINSQNVSDFYEYNLHFNGYNNICYICNNKNNIYIFTEKALYVIKYYKNNFTLTKKIYMYKLNDLNALKEINYLINQKFQKNNVILNCIYNKYDKYDKYKITEPDISDFITENNFLYTPCFFCQFYWDYFHWTYYPCPHYNNGIFICPYEEESIKKEKKKEIKKVKKKNKKKDKKKKCFYKKNIKKLII